MLSGCIKGVMWMPWTSQNIKTLEELFDPLDIHNIGLFIGGKKKGFIFISLRQS